jgi:hypothetical protein
VITFLHAAGVNFDPHLPVEETTSISANIMADTSTDVPTDAHVEAPVSQTATAVSTDSPTNVPIEVVTDAPADASTEASTPAPPAPRETNRENLSLFDRTILVFTTSARATQTLIEESNKDLPEAIKKLEMAQRILHAHHPQRQRHIDVVDNFKKLEVLGNELLSDIASQRADFIANTPEYSTGLFAEHNQTCVARLLETIKIACTKFKDTCPKVVDGAPFKRLEGLENHFERCRWRVFSVKRSD